MEILTAFLAAVAAPPLTVGALWLGQRRLLFRANRQRVTPASVGLPTVDEHILTMADGTRLIAWWGKANPGQPTILYFHGNARNLARRKPHFERMMQAGFGVLMPAYRGYSGSAGRPSELAVVADGVAILDFALAAGVARHRLIVYGASLGAAVAIQVAVQRRPPAVVLLAPFLSIPALLQRVWGGSALGSLTWDRFESEQHIKGLQCPVLILHGTRDMVVPVAHGRALAKLMPDQITYQEFPNGGHNDLYEPPNLALPHLTNFIAGLGLTATAAPSAAERRIDVRST